MSQESEHRDVPDEAAIKASCVRKSKINDGLCYLAAAVGFVVIGIVTDALRSRATSESLTNNSLDLISPFMVLVGLFMFVLALFKLISADRHSDR